MVKQPIKEKKNSEFKQALVRFKTDLVSHPACDEAMVVRVNTV